MLRGHRAAVAVLCLVISAGSARAEEACDAEDAERRVGEITRLLDSQAKKMRLWNLAWGTGYSVAAVVQGALTIKPSLSPDDFGDDFRASLGVGAGKAAVAGLSRFILPLKGQRFERAEGEDACTALDRAKKALRFTAKKQKRAFWLNHLGGIVLNGTGVVVLGVAYDNWSGAVVSFVVGTAVGAASSYTMPRGAWKAKRKWFPQGITVRPYFKNHARGLAVRWAF